MTYIFLYCIISGWKVYDQISPDWDKEVPNQDCLDYSDQTYTDITKVDFKATGKRSILSSSENRKVSTIYTYFQFKPNNLNLICRVNDSGQTTTMAAMYIYGKNLSKSYL